MMTLLWSVLILAGLGLLFGVALTVFGAFFHVKEDPRIKDVEAMLPHYNCGACGYAGCHQMAEALVKGQEDRVSKCKPGKKEANYDPIVAYLSAHPDEDGTLHVPKI